MSLEDFYTRFPDNNKCLEYIELLKWGNSPHCPYCSSTNFTHIKENKRYHCNTCNTSYSVTVGTIFHRTRLELQKWFYAIYIISNSDEGVSSRQLAIEIKTTKDTAWNILNKIRNAIKENDTLIIKFINNERT